MIAKLLLSCEMDLNSEPALLSEAESSGQLEQKHRVFDISCYSYIASLF